MGCGILTHPSIVPNSVRFMRCLTKIFISKLGSSEASGLNLDGCRGSYGRSLLTHTDVYFRPRATKPKLALVFPGFACHQIESPQLVGPTAQSVEHLESLDKGLVFRDTILRPIPGEYFT